MSPARALPAPHAPALTLLFARYVAGQIAEAQWSQLADALDAADATSGERTALARFYLDATAAGADVALPKPEEILDVLALTRA